MVIIPTMDSTRHRFVNQMHKHYSSEIATMLEKDLWAAKPHELSDKTLAFLLALENVKVSTIASLDAVNGNSGKKIEAVLKKYAKSKEASIRLHRSKIDKLAKQKTPGIVEVFKRFEKERENTMYR